jgi:hypothetical protein
MKPFKIKTAIAVMFITITMFTLNSCKKPAGDAVSESTETTKAKAIRATIERYGRVTAPIIFQPMQAASGIFYKDVTGNMVQYAGGENRIEATCGQYTCSTTSDPNDLYVTYTLEYVKWYYTCGTGHDLTAIWKVSVPYTLLLQSGSNYSYGNIRIKSGGTVLITSGNLGQGNMTITNLGADPGCTSNTLYTVTYTWHDVADTYFPDNSIEASFTIYNDCAITNYNTMVGYTFGATYTNQNDVFTHPCDRTDQAWVTLNTGPNNCATILGAYVICTPPSGFTGADEHHVQYRAVKHFTSKLWDDQSSSINSGIDPGTNLPSATLYSCCDVLYLTNMVPSSGQWLVRYRNKHSGCNGTGSGDWGTNYVTEYFNL